MHGINILPRPQLALIMDTQPPAVTKGLRNISFKWDAGVDRLVVDGVHGLRVFCVLEWTCGKCGRGPGVAMGFWLGIGQH